MSERRSQKGAWSAELDRSLAANSSKAARERLTLIQLFEEFRGLGCAAARGTCRPDRRLSVPSHP
jgi:hypothetical protein